MNPSTQAILVSALTSLLGLSGGLLLLWKYDAVKKFSHIFVSFAAGALLGAVFFDLLTEGVGEFPDQVTTLFTWVAGGFLVFFLIEKILIWHHHEHDEDRHDDDRPVIAPLIIFGDALHNFIDGIIIAATFLVDPGLGIATAVAIFFHELPQEIGDFSIMIHSGMARKKVILWNVVGALVSPVATILTLSLAGVIDGIELPLLGLAAGSFLYIAAADLVPEIHRHKGLKSAAVQTSLLILGMLAIVGVGILFPHGGHGG